MLLLAEALDLRDPSTARHSYTVGRYARATAIALGLGPERVERIHAAGVLHDLRLDGLGYPRQLTADEISLEARILAVADAYEAMIAERCYRPAMTEEDARAELLRCAGTQFDPEVVEDFLGAINAMVGSSGSMAAAA